MTEAAIPAQMSTPASLAWTRFKTHRLALASLCVLLVLALLSAAAPLLETVLGVDATTVNLLNRYSPPSAEHWLGTDELGRDVLIRLLYGGRVSLAVALAAASTAAVIGTLIGLMAGYFGGRLDSLLMRFTDGVIAMPILPLLIVVAAIDLTKLGFDEETANAQLTGVIKIILIIALFSWTTVARLVRAATLSVREREYTEAARALGASTPRVLLVHILPNVVSPIVVAMTLSMGVMILVESALSFLGLGIQAPLPTWGNMLSGALEFVYTSPALAVWPGLLIFITVISFNFLGDGLQDALDPRALQRKKA